MGASEPPVPGTPNSARPAPGGPAADPRRRLLEDTLGAQYEVIRLLGEGAAGAVYLARERLLERLVAIKMLRSEFVSADTRERFVREARTAARLMHAHIVPLYSFGPAGDTLYYVMGYVEGESLEAALSRPGRMDPDEARRILVEVADALAYAHRQGVVHRDVKPDNILIDRQTRRALLTDFGIAKEHATQSTLTHTGMVVGTPLYMSPEQAAGDAAIDGRSDLYSLGVIGYRMLAGRLPIEGASAQDVMRRHVMSDPEPLARVAPDAPMDLAFAVTRCLDKDAARRWPTAEALRQALETGDEAAGELPEQLAYLSGIAWRLLRVAWLVAVVGAAAWARTARQEWLGVAAGAPLAALAALWLLNVAARRTGLATNRAWRLIGAPPERWAGWWPAALRRVGDVWDRLPGVVALSRTLRSALTAALTLALSALAVIVARGLDLRSGPGLTYALLLAGGVVVVGAAQVLSRWSATRALSAHGVSPRTARRWLSEPTWGSPFWRRPEAVAVLHEPPPAPQLPLDSRDDDSYSIITPTQVEIRQGMFDHVDPRSPTPLYAQIASRLRVAIAAGELQPGDGLPSVRQLAGRLRINPATVVQAYRELEVEGLVNTRQGAGTFVQEVAPDRRQKDRLQEARRLVREMLANAASLGIPASDLRAALDREFKGDGR